MVASFWEEAPVPIVEVSEAEPMAAALSGSGTASPHWDPPLLQPLYEPVFPQQIRVIERERAVHRFGK